MKKTHLLAAAVVVGLSVVVMAEDAGTFTDTRDGKVYKTVKIGSQVWFAENLNYDVPNVDTDRCLDNKPSNCAKYGRRYGWKTAQEACPAGWHLSTYKEWDILEKYVGGDSDKLKNGKEWFFNRDFYHDKKWYNKKWPDDDVYGFSALPDGIDLWNEACSCPMTAGAWLTSTTSPDGYACGRGMTSYGSGFTWLICGKNMGLHYVRCVQD